MSAVTFQVAVKALHYKEGKLLLIKDDKGDWDLPGGRIGYGESLQQALQRECFEEIGVQCKITDERPKYVWPALNKSGTWRINVCYTVELDSIEFKPSEENVEYGYFSINEAKQLNLCLHLKQLSEIK
ncbi:MAG TPA: NUDIX hydrolase [Verrucomicrobiae bacterium]|nr:NUDIX hydrolase [Verrucomicrobiae bacterium]